ncbi:MAG: hypothetical protein WAM85_01700 [Terracidiphilus sp.]
MTFQQYILGHAPLVLFIAKVALLWMLANYTYPAGMAAEPGDRNKRRPRWWPWLTVIVTRSAVLACAVAWIAGWNIGLGVFTLALAILLPLARDRIASRYLAELEIGANLLFGLGVVYLAILEDIPPAIPMGSEAASRQRSVVYLVVAIALFVMRGGSSIVRGILDKGQLLAERGAPGGGMVGLQKQEREIPEYNRGRIVGIIERLMLMTFVAVQAYDALAFLLTAKGLFRSKELDKPAFAEYFLVGTLTSSMMAIAGGFVIQLLLKWLW